jgi:hypothetical protein
MIKRRLYSRKRPSQVSTKSDKLQPTSETPLIAKTTLLDIKNTSLPNTAFTSSSLRTHTSQTATSTTAKQKTTMTKFRPCIDLHAGSVKQIVGGTLTTTTSELKTNFTSKLPSSYYANLYKENVLEGAHVIMLGPGNEDACREACEAWPGHLQVGGGIKDENAREWIERGASKVSFV